MSYKRLFEIPHHQSKQYPQQQSIAAKVNGEWKYWSTTDVIAEIESLALGLIDLGIEAGDKVAILSENRPEWNFTDLAVLSIGAIDVPVYPTISPADYRYIFNDAEVKVCFVSSREMFDKVQSIRTDVPSLKHIFSFDEGVNCSHWRSLQSKNNQQKDLLEARRNQVNPDDLATLIYTSGTTGVPKGVMLSHQNIISNIKSAAKDLPIGHTHRALSFLPLCHSFERMVCYLYMAVGTSIYYAESLDTIGDNLKEVRPHFFTAVPRLLEKVYEKILAKGYALSPPMKGLFIWALKLGLRYELHGRGWWYNLQLKLANALVFKKWRAALGGEIIMLVTGAAALQERLARVFNAGGINVREGYGLTESSPVISFNRLEIEGMCFGTVGLPIDGVEIKLAEDGELLCRGPNVMLGYYKKPEATAEVLTADGWLHTGDIVELVAGKFIKIIDRKKELYKTSGGKYIPPQALENRLKESPYIEQIMVVGDNKKFVSAIIVPSADRVMNYCRQAGLRADDFAAALEEKKVMEKYRQIVDQYNANFAQYEQIKRFLLVPDSWSPETGELTPTMKVKRRVILDKYADQIAGLYRNT